MSWRGFNVSDHLDDLRLAPQRVNLVEARYGWVQASD
jgi:hypothetical protein